MGRGLLIRVGIIGALLVGGFLIKQFVSGSAGDLSVGDCFDPPTAAGVEVKDVQHHPCTDLHGGEVVYVGKISNLTDYPTEDQLTQFISDNCLPAYTAYVGTDVFSIDGADLGWFSPTSDGWTKGDRGVICYATRLDNAPTKGSGKKD
jgi:hypothetical protein